MGGLSLAVGDKVRLIFDGTVAVPEFNVTTLPADLKETIASTLAASISTTPVAGYKAVAVGTELFVIKQSAGAFTAALSVVRAGQIAANGTEGIAVSMPATVDASFTYRLRLGTSSYDGQGASAAALATDLLGKINGDGATPPFAAIQSSGTLIIVSASGGAFKALKSTRFDRIKPRNLW